MAPPLSEVTPKPGIGGSAGTFAGGGLECEGRHPSRRNRVESQEFDDAHPTGRAVSVELSAHARRNIPNWRSMWSVPFLAQARQRGEVVCSRLDRPLLATTFVDLTNAARVRLDQRRRRRSEYYRPRPVREFTAHLSHSFDSVACQPDLDALGACCSNTCQQTSDENWYPHTTGRVPRVVSRCWSRSCGLLFPVLGGRGS